MAAPTPRTALPLHGDPDTSRWVVDTISTPAASSLAAETRPDEHHDRPWSLALSGGGHRASLFAAGVLLYLADCGELRRVSSVASVSGGSITNGVLAVAGDDALDGDGLRRHLRDLLRRCALTGTVQYAREAKVVLGVAGLALLGTIAAAVWCGLGGLGGRGVAAAVLVACLVVLVVAYESISRVAEAVFDRMFFDGMQLRQVRSPMAHVFCATELQSQAHLYLSPGFVYNNAFTQRPTPPATIRLSAAVQASACFPPVFPTRRFHAGHVGLPSRFARRVWLADGGVFDNMGDEWARAYQAAVVDGAPPDMGPVPAKLLVVNSSGDSAGHRASWLNRVPLLGDLYALKSETDVMYKETTLPRRVDMWAQFDLARQLQSEHSPLAANRLGGSLLHIATPATWPRDSVRPPGGVRPQDWQAALSALGALDDDERAALEKAARRSAAVGTSLSGIGSEDATDLLWHGYTLAMVNFVVFEGFEWTWRSRGHFADLVSGKHAPTSSAMA